MLANKVGGGGLTVLGEYFYDTLPLAKSLAMNITFDIIAIGGDMQTTQQLVGALISRGMTQKRIASAIGCSQAAVSLWLSGKREAGGKHYARLLEEVKSVV